jgi:hypothetical protein
MNFVKVYSTPEWLQHLDQLGRQVGLANRGDVVNEAVRMLAISAGMKPMDRYPDRRLDRERLNLSRLIQLS